MTAQELEKKLAKLQAELKKATGTLQIVARINFLAEELRALQEESPTALRHTMAQIGWVPSSDVQLAVLKERERMMDRDDRDLSEKIRYPRDFEM